MSSLAPGSYLDLLTSASQQQSQNKSKAKKNVGYSTKITVSKGK